MSVWVKRYVLWGVAVAVAPVHLGGGGKGKRGLAGLDIEAGVASRRSRAVPGGRRVSQGWVGWGGVNEYMGAGGVYCMGETVPRRPPAGKMPPRMSGRAALNGARERVMWGTIWVNWPTLEGLDRG